jgi:hypothetical protein
MARGAPGAHGGGLLNGMPALLARRLDARAVRRSAAGSRVRSRRPTATDRVDPRRELRRARPLARRPGDELGGVLLFVVAIVGVSLRRRSPWARAPRGAAPLAPPAAAL